MSYLHGVSIRKGGSAALPAIPAVLVVLAVRRIWGVELSPEEGIALAGVIASCLAYLRNRFKHAWRGRR